MPRMLGASWPFPSMIQLPNTMIYEGYGLDNEWLSTRKLNVPRLGDQIKRRWPDQIDAGESNSLRLSLW
jgi:hypothetical protein